MTQSESGLRRVLRKTDIPEPYCIGDYSGKFKLRIPKSLHKLPAEKTRERGNIHESALFGPKPNDITVIGLEPHPEDKKNGSYDRI